VPTSLSDGSQMEFLRTTRSGPEAVSGRFETNGRDAQMEEKQKFPKATEVIAEQPRRDTYGTEHGSGDPHTNWDDKPLSESETWKSHASRKPAKPAKK